MEDILRRIGSLESDMKDVKAALGRMEPLLIRIDERTKDMPSAKEYGEVKGRVMLLPTGEAFGEIKGKLSLVPSTFQMATWFTGVALSLVGVTFAIARAYLSH